jgi:hypothetical protein
VGKFKFQNNPTRLLSNASVLLHVLCRLLEAVEANEDPSSFKTLALVFRVRQWSAFIEQLVRVKKVAISRVVFLVVLPTIK